MSKIQPEDRYQQQLFSSLDDQVEKSSIVRVIDLIIDKIYQEGEKTEEESKGEVGRPEYPRSSLLKLYVYGYMNRVKSSRKLERECKVNLEVLWLMGKMQPDHWTISFFRKENQAEIKHAVKQLVRFLKGSGYLEGKTVVIDGTKLKANASVYGNMHKYEIEERIKEVEQKIENYLETIEKEDEQTEQIEKLKKEKEELVKQIEKLKSENKKVYIKTDPEANIINRQPSYNIQVSCDKKNKLIVATDVTDQVNDFKQLVSMYDRSKEMLGEKPEEVITDKGYYCPEDIQELEEKEKVQTYISEMPERTKGKFTYNQQKDEYICTQGKKLKFDGQRKDSRGRYRRFYKTKECKGCPIKNQCTTSKDGRLKIRYVNQDFRDAYREKMQREDSKKKMSLRRTIAEHPFATMKLWLGKNPLLLRGKENVHTEIRLISFSYNLLRVFNLDGCNNLIEKVYDFNWSLA
jgi:transposase